MAINDKDNGNEGSAISSAFSKVGLSGQGQPAADEQRGHGRRTSSAADLTAAGIDTFYGRSMRQTPASQSTKEFEKVFSKLLADTIQPTAGDPITFHANSIDSQDSQDVAISCTLIIGAFEATGKKYASVFTLLLDGSMDSYPSREIRDAPPVNGRFPELQMTAGDYADDPLWNAIVAKLTNVYGGEYEFLKAGNATIPRFVNVAKIEEWQNTIYSTLFVAVGAIETMAERDFAIGAGPLTIHAITNRATNQIVMDLNDTPDHGATGLPIRNDVSMTLRATVRVGVPGVPDKVIDIVKTSMFVNLLYQVPPPPSPNQRPDTRRFVPQIVLTHLASKTSLMTPETQVLSLAMAPLLDYNDQYLAPFTASATANRPMRDFGAVGLEVNLSGDDNGAPVGKEDLTKLSTAEFFQLARMSLFDEVRVALAIDESGPLTWLNSMFLGAANQTSGPEYDAIIQACNNLTGDIFGQIWNGGPITVSNGTRYHVGYYLDDNNEQRDLLDIDYLWMLNRCGAKNLETVYDFSDTYFDNNHPDVQLINRWAIIQRLVRSATLVGYGQIVEANPDFLVTLIQAIKSAGLPLRANNSLVDFQNARGRASYSGVGGLNSSVIGATLNAGGNERRGPQAYGGLGMNSNWVRPTR
jgi:hypothetical protein